MIESLISTIRQTINVHVLNPIFICIADHIPACDDALVPVPLVLEQLANFECDISRALGPSDDRFAHGIYLVHTLHELQQPMAFRLIIEHGDDVA